MCRRRLLPIVLVLAAGPAIMAVCAASAVAASTASARLDGGALRLEAREQPAGVAISLKDSRGLE